MLNWDRDVLLWINLHHSNWLDAILYPVTFVGELGAIWIATGIVFLVSRKPPYRQTAVLLAVTLLLVDFGPRLFLAHLFPRERPYLVVEGVRQVGFAWTSNSFPSGHAHSAFIGLLIVGNQIPKAWLVLLVFALLTIYSRPYFGMHYPLDVISGSVLGIAAGSVAVYVNRRRTDNRKRVAKESVAS